MEFWGVEVKAGEPLKVSPDDNAIIHLSQAALGESKKGNEPVMLFVRVGDKRLVLGTLSNDNFPQLSFDVVFEQEFELSHNWKHGSVYFCGYQTAMPDDDEDDMFGSSDDEVKDLPLMDADNGKKLDAKVENAKPAAASAKPTAPLAEPTKASKPEEKPDEDEDDDSEGDSEDEDDSDDNSGDEDEEGLDDEDEDESGESGSEDEETPVKVEIGKKRSGDSATKTPIASKKAKAVSPQKTDGKKNVHTATPHPAKNAGKTAANGNKQTPKSGGGQFSCKSCERSFNSDNALQSHTKAKHSK